MAVELEHLRPVIGEPIDDVAWIRTEPRERGHVLRPHDHADRIELERVHAPRHPPYVGETGAAGAGAPWAEPLRGKREAARGTGREQRRAHGRRP